MPKRSYSAAGSYRYGFNGKENDNDVKGLGNQQDYGMRIYDARVGRFFSVDPITDEYPELTPYQFASNRPIDGIDQDGLEWLPPMKTDENGNMVPDAEAETRMNTAIINLFVEKHRKGMQNVNLARTAEKLAKQAGRTDNGGINWYTKALLYIAPWWQSTATYSDANDAAVLMSGSNLDGTPASTSDYVAAGVGIFIPFVSGSGIKNVFKGFTTSIEGYKFGGKTFKNAQEFEQGLAKAGTANDRVAMIETVTRDVAKTNSWKKAGDLSKKTGREFYELGDGMYGSIDKLHGHIEVFKKEGKTLSHQGSINIDGIKNKEANKSYDIKL